MAPIDNLDCISVLVLLSHQMDATYEMTSIHLVLHKCSCFIEFIKRVGEEIKPEVLQSLTHSIKQENEC